MSASEFGSVERFVEEEDDWIDVLSGSFRAEFLETVRRVPIERLRRFPPKKRGSVPFGHELRVLRSFLSGESSLFDPSAFSGLYHRMSSPRERSLYRAFVLNQSAPRAEWSEMIGTAAADAWRERGLLREEDGALRSRFCLYSIGKVSLLGDPADSKLLRRVLVGQDSHNMAKFMTQQPLGHYGRYLDVGPGSGVVLLTVSPWADACVGLDINPRAVAISRLNAELNRITNCQIQLEDAIENGASHGPFDLVTWNTPFVFLPEECKDTHYDGYGGELGMEIPLNFARVLPELLGEGGRAYFAVAAPITKSGENLLEKELRQVAGEKGLDIREHITQLYWHALYRDFHEAHGIAKFEHSFLEVTRGSGRVDRVEAPLGSRLSDKAREVAFSVRK